MPEAARLQTTLLAPFATRRDEWRRLDRRIAALDTALSARIDALTARRGIFLPPREPASDAARREPRVY